MKEKVVAMGIGRAVRLLGIPRRRLYYLEETEKIGPVPRSTSGQRVFTPRVLRQIQRVLEGAGAS